MNKEIDKNIKYFLYLYFVGLEQDCDNSFYVSVFKLEVILVIECDKHS